MPHGSHLWAPPGRGARDGWTIVENAPELLLPALRSEGDGPSRTWVGLDGVRVLVGTVPRDITGDDVVSAIQAAASLGDQQAVRTVVIGAGLSEGARQVVAWLVSTGSRIAVSEAGLPASAHAPLDPSDVDVAQVDDLQPLGQMFPWLMSQGGSNVLALAEDIGIAVPKRVRAALVYNETCAAGALARSTLREFGDAPMTGLKASRDLLVMLHGIGRVLAVPPLTILELPPGPNIDEVSDQGAAPPEWDAVVNEWIGSLDDRERNILTRRVLRRASTLDELGRDFGVTRERIRQVEKLVVADVHNVVDEGEWAPVRAHMASLASSLGSWAQLSEPHLNDAGRLALALAGYSVLEQGAVPVAVKDAADLPTREDLVTVSGGGYVLDGPIVDRLLSMSGVLGEHRDHYLESLGFTNRAGQWIVWGNSYVDRALALLELAGEPMPTDEIAGAVGSRSIRSVRQRLLEDERVQRVGVGKIALRAWGQPEYTSTANLMQEVIEREGGSVSVGTLAEELGRRHEVKPSTVHAYSKAPMFIRVGEDVRVRGDDEPWEFPESIRQSPSVHSEAAGLVRWEVEVDSETLRGSGLGFPLMAAKLLDIRPGTTEVFELRGLGEGDLEMRVRWPLTSVAGPMCSSLRAVAIALGAEDGDVMQFSLDKNEAAASVQRLPAN